MKDYTEATDTYQYVMRRGGHNAMSQGDYRRLAGIIRRHFEEIDALSGRIGEGRYSEGQIAVYSGNIINGTRESAEVGHAQAYGLELPAYPADGSTICKKGDKCYWDIVKLSGNGNFDAYWRRTVSESCPTCIQRANEWSPLKVRNWEY